MHPTPPESRLAIPGTPFSAVLYACRITGARSTGREHPLPDAEAPFFEELLRRALPLGRNAVRPVLLLYRHQPHLVTPYVASTLITILGRGVFEAMPRRIIQEVLSLPLPAHLQRLWSMSDRQPKRTRSYTQDVVRHLPRDILREVIMFCGYAV